MADNAHGFSRNETGGAVKSGALRGVELAGTRVRQDLRTPQNLVRHPVPDPVKSPLMEKHGLDRGTGVTVEELVHEASGKLRRSDLGSGSGPPIRLGISMMKAHPAEEARIAEDERTGALAEHKVVVFRGAKISRRDAEFTRHAKVQAEPVAAGKTEEHLLAARL